MNACIGAQLEDVHFAYGGEAILRGVSFTAPAGKCTVLFGPTGAGKTTCLRLLAGLERPDTGTIRIGAEEVASSQRCTLPRARGVGLCFQENALWPSVSARDHLRVVLADLPLSRQEREARVEELLALYHLESLARRYPHQLSGGEKKRLEMARAVARRPRLLLLDEPLASQEIPLREELARTIGLCLCEGGTVIAVTHEREEMYAMAEYLVLLGEGQALRCGTPREVFHDPRSAQAARLLGLHNLFPVTLENGRLRSSLGDVEGGWNVQGAWMAACRNEEIEVEACGGCGASAISCHAHARHYVVRFELEGRTLTGVAQQPVVPGQALAARLTERPILVEKIEETGSRGR